MRERGNQGVSEQGNQGASEQGMLAWRPPRDVARRVSLQDNLGVRAQQILAPSLSRSLAPSP